MIEVDIEIVGEIVIEIVIEIVSGSEVGARLRSGRSLVDPKGGEARRRFRQ